MEAIGAVNCYQPYGWSGKPLFSINLSCGVTPFMHFDHGQEFASTCYRLPPGGIKVTFAWFRPGPEQFKKMMDAGLQDHILNGGLTHAPLVEAAAARLIEDPVDTTWEYKQFAEFCKKTYGRRHGEPFPPR